MTFEWSLDENLFWKETFGEWKSFILMEKNNNKIMAILLSDKCILSFSPFSWFKKGGCQFLAKEYAQYQLTA